MQSQCFSGVKLLPVSKDATMKASVGLGERQGLGHHLCAHGVILVSARACFSPHIMPHCATFDPKQAK